MNDSLSVYLNLDMENRSRNEEVIRKIDKLLLTVGMKYSGIMNIYVPVDRQKRDQAVFQAEELLRATDWLKDILAYTMVGTLTNACPVEEILTDRMSNPSPEKLWYYEQYYQKTGQLPHAIVVDENRQLRDGYISWLLAKKYDVQADVYEMVSDILLVNTKRGTDFMCVHKIDYISGRQFCSKYKKVRKHTNKHMEEGEAAGYEK